MAVTLQAPSKKSKKSTDQLHFAFGPGKDAPRTPPEPAMHAKNIKTPKRQIAKTYADKSKSRKGESKEPLAPREQDPAAKPPRTGRHRYATAETMSRAQREISVSEFFAKNRHLLGFDNKRKALLTTVKEAVDNSLDACEEAGILPDVHVKITHVEDEKYVVTVRDNGPGIVKNQIPNIFGKLLYGSKFHRLKMSRGQQGIGISAAGMYGLLTTGKSVIITSRTGSRASAHYYELQINTKTNDPQVVKDKTVDVDWPHGTEVAITLVANYQKGRGSVDEYLELTAIANPHATIAFVDSDGSAVEFARGTQTPPPPAVEIKPHPYGIELGVLIKMLKDTRAKTMTQFLHGEFSRVSTATAGAICDTAKVSSRARPSRIGTHEAETLYKAMQETPIRAPATDCLSPIGEKQILAGLLKGVQAEFFTATTRSPSVYRGNPFQIEVGLAYGGELGPDPAELEREAQSAQEAVVKRGKVVQEAPRAQPAKLMRFANRVPLLYQASGCCIYKSTVEIDWRRYGLSQPSGALPVGPLAVFVHMASVWVPFTSEGKEAIADYDEIRKEIKLAVQDCCRKLQGYLNRRKKQKYESDRRSIFTRYIGEVVNSCASIKRINKEELTKNLLAIATRVTARADEELDLKGKVKVSAGGKNGAGVRARKGSAGVPPAAEDISSEYGENTIVVDRAVQAPGPLFQKS
jgi:DNA topoisomerase-6 subunit B